MSELSKDSAGCLTTVLLEIAAIKGDIEGGREIDAGRWRVIEGELSKVRDRLEAEGDT